MHKHTTKLAISTSLILAVLAITGCGGGGPATTPVATGITPQKMADALHAVMESDRTIYTKKVVNRLQN